MNFIKIKTLIKIKTQVLSFPCAPGGGYPLGHPFIKVLTQFKTFVIGSPLKACGDDNVGACGDDNVGALGMTTGKSFFKKIISNSAVKTN